MSEVRTVSTWDQHHSWIDDPSCKNRKVYNSKKVENCTDHLNLHSSLHGYTCGCDTFNSCIRWSQSKSHHQVCPALQELHACGLLAKSLFQRLLCGRNGRSKYKQMVIKRVEGSGHKNNKKDPTQWSYISKFFSGKHRFQLKTLNTVCSHTCRVNKLRRNLYTTANLHMFRSL